MKKSFVVLAVTGAMLIAAAAPAAASHAWSAYHWGRQSPSFTLQLGDNLTADWDSHLTVSSSDWSASSVLDTIVVPGKASNVKRCPAVTGRVEVCNAKYGNNGWLGLAQIWLSGGHIVKGVVKVNDTYFALAQYNNPGEKLHVMCQEVGHTFGLGHQDESGANLGTCMDYSSSTSTSDANAHPNAHDFEQLTSIYGHADTSTTVGAATQGASRSQSTRTNVDANGNGTVTHIYWIDGHH